MGHPFRAPDKKGTVYRGTLSGDGRPGPIEVRLGRRLVRLIDPESTEGARLLVEGRVDLVGPDGTRMGAVRAADALRRLRERLEHRLEGAAPQEREWMDEGLGRIEDWSRRLLD